MSNISQKKRAAMLAYLAELKQVHNDDESIRALNEIEAALTEKKYGLVWEEHTEQVDQMLEDNIPVFIEDEARKIVADPDQPFNFLIEGDNLHSLKLLEKTHKGKIDIIYIDPPYNTGNKDFKYDDNFVDLDDGYRHSKWLSFMNRRLKLANELLSEDGIIFVSIDKNEGFQLKLLMDEIFGEDSMVADLHVETSIIGGPRRIPAMKGSVVKTAEFVLGYTKSKDTLIMKQPKFDYIPGYDTHYSLFYDDSQKTIISLLEVLKNTEFIKEVFKALNLRVSLKNLEKVIYSSEKVRNWLYSEDIAKRIFRKSDSVGDLPKEVTSGKPVNSLIVHDNKPYIVDKNNVVKGLFVYWDRIGPTDDYFNSFGERSVRGNLWKGFQSDGGNLAKEGGVSFKKGKKPIRLIKQLIHSVREANDNDITVLDFFAGSGTTGHTVVALNQEDVGKRKYILCTNNENNICEEVTYKRLTNIQEELPHNLKYYKTDFIPKLSSEEDILSDRLLSHIKEMVELENMCEIDGVNRFIFLREDDLQTWYEQGVSKGATIYIPSYILLSREVENELEAKQVKVVHIPDYYFLNELREANEL